MRLITQKGPMGCGIACIASLLRISYIQSEKLFQGGKIKTQKTGLLCREILSVLEKKKLSYVYKYIKPKYRKYIYKNGTIIFIQRSKKYPFGHYLLRGNNRWMDPWINWPSNIQQSKAGWRKRLPGKPIYMIGPISRS